jgi:hypothetical protein
MRTKKKVMPFRAFEKRVVTKSLEEPQHSQVRAISNNNFQANSKIIFLPFCVELAVFLCVARILSPGHLHWKLVN